MSYKLNRMVFGFWVFSLILLLAGISSASLNVQKISIVTSLFPLQEFAQAVGGERVKVELLLPPGAEPHTWDPKPSDLVTLSKTDIFIYLGAGLEPWLHDLLKGVNRPSLKVIEISQGLPMIKDEESHLDPHLWLDFSLDQVIIDRLAVVFSEIDPKGTDLYHQRALEYKERLKKLDQEYTHGLSKCSHRRLFVAGHAAFGYLAKRYQMEQIPLYGLSPDAEPTPKRLAEVVQIARKEGIRAIFFESLVSDRTAKALAKEIGGAHLLVLNPGPNLTREQIKAGVGFIPLMEDNLRNLREGLGCE